MNLAYLYWDIDPELINLFGFPIRYYGLLFAIGILMSLYVLRRIFKKEGIPLEDLERLTTYAIVGIMLGARLGHCLFYEPDYYLSHPIEILLPITFDYEGRMLYVGYQGLASHGGVLGLLIALLIYAKKTGNSLLTTMDLLAITSGLTAGFIRLANFTNSEIIGIPTEKAWGVIFAQIDDILRHPAQLYEALAYFTIFGIMLFLYRTQKKKLNSGFFFGLFIVLLFSARFMIEFIKEDQVAFEEGMSLNMGQLLSIPYLLFGLGMIAYSMRKQAS